MLFFFGSTASDSARCGSSIACCASVSGRPDCLVRSASGAWFGLFVGVLQAATQVNEASIAFVSKLIAVGLCFALLGSWTVRQLVDYTGRTIASIADVTR